MIPEPNRANIRLRPDGVFKINSATPRPGSNDLLFLLSQTDQKLAQQARAEDRELRRKIQPSGTSLEVQVKSLAAFAVSASLVESKLLTQMQNQFSDTSDSAGSK